MPVYNEIVAGNSAYVKYTPSVITSSYAAATENPFANCSEYIKAYDASIQNEIDFIKKTKDSHSASMSANQLLTDFADLNRIRNEAFSNMNNAFSCLRGMLNKMKQSYDDGVMSANIYNRNVELHENIVKDIAYILISGQILTLDREYQWRKRSACIGTPKMLELKSNLDAHILLIANFADTLKNHESYKGNPPQLIIEYYAKASSYAEIIKSGFEAKEDCRKYIPRGLNDKPNPNTQQTQAKKQQPQLTHSDQEIISRLEQSKKKY
jgi:hypothetical protein